jgi:hypothetical protein
MENTVESSEGIGSRAKTPGLASVVTTVHSAFKAQTARIDALNVYPVPDGDTGTNMLMTLRSVLDEVSEGSSELSGEAAAKMVSRAALMGARGNSGVILSQMVRGACEALGNARIVDAAALTDALAGAKERAYSSVREPVEGTMLSVIKDAAAAARTAFQGGEGSPMEVLRAAASEAHASVRRTPELLSVLREAGVVDAGGLGVAVILDAIRSAFGGEKVAFEEYPDEAAPDAGRWHTMVEHSAEEAWGYCTEFMVNHFSGNASEFEASIHGLGKSVLVVSDDDLVKVHIHTQDPGEALSFAGGFGRLSGVKVDDMEAQTRTRAEDREDAGAPLSANLGVVVASRGEGNKALFENMGALVVEGGQGANPSASELASAAEETLADHVILLPNNKNVVATAEQVQQLVEGIEIRVVPTSSIASGLAAMIGFDPEGEPGEVSEEMGEIVSGLRCAEVTRAVRDARVEGREVHEGEYIGFLDGELVAVEEGVEDAALRLVEKMLESGVDMVTLLRGYGMDESSAEKVAEGIRLLGAEIEVEVKDGGQPLYPLQMVAE